MKINRAAGFLVIDQIDSVLAELLRRIPAAADPGESRAARERIFSNPEEVKSSFNEDWKAYVQPGLRHLFQSAMETVSSDLDAMGESDGGEGSVLRIPDSHLDAWLNATNQARLVLAAKNGFSDGELSSELPGPVATERELNLFQIHFYGYLQECLLHEMAP